MLMEIGGRVGLKLRVVVRTVVVQWTYRYLSHFGNYYLILEWLLPFSSLIDLNDRRAHRGI